MKYSEFKAEVKVMLLEDGEIHGTENYLERHIRVSLLEALSFFPTLKPDSLLNVPSSEVIIDGNACEVGIPAAITMTELRVIPSGYAFDDEDGVEATTNGSGVLTAPALADGDTIVISDSSGTGWAVETLLHIVDSGGSLTVSETAGGSPLTESDAGGSTILYRKASTATYETSDRLGPLTRIPWDRRYQIINGLVNSCDLLYAVSPDRDTLIVHPIIDFEKILQISHRTLGTKFADDDEIHVPEAVEDRFITACSDYVRSRLSKDVDRNGSMAGVNFAEYKRQLRSIFKEIPR